MVCHSEEQQVSVLLLEICGKCIRVLQQFDSTNTFFPLSYISVEIRRLFPVLDNNYEPLVFHSVENKNDFFICLTIISKVLTLIAVDPHCKGYFSF